MISKDDIKDLHSSDSFVRCFVCNKPVADKIFYEIRQSNNGATGGYYEFFVNSKYRKNIVFHAACFKDFAGEEFMFSDE